MYLGGERTLQFCPGNSSFTMPSLPIIGADTLQAILSLQGNDSQRVNIDPWAANITSYDGFGEVTLNTVV